MWKSVWVRFSVFLAVVLFANIIVHFFSFRLDLTSEGRYSLSRPTKSLLKKAKGDVHTIVYLSGDLNAPLLRLKRASKDLLDEMGIYAAGDWNVEFIDLSEGVNEKERNNRYAALANRGLKPRVIQEKDDEGKISGQLVFPWAEIIYGGDTLSVPLLDKETSLPLEEQVNRGIENLEYAFSDALRILFMRKSGKIDKIAFLEGHGELAPEQVYDASAALSRYFEVDRGTISNNASVLNPYKALVIAGPRSPFSETEKFIIDQYVMNGGRILWLVDGVRVETDSLSHSGASAAVALDVNLNDMLFRYGARLVPVVLQDMQCIQVPMNVAPKGETPKWEGMPFYYSPLLLTSPESPITRNIGEVKATMASGIDIHVNDNDKNIRKQVLLVTSNASRADATPAIIDLSKMYEGDSKQKFTSHYLPVAASLEGKFPSAFANRLQPEGVLLQTPQRDISKQSRMVIVANSEIIRNDIAGNGTQQQIIPLGYDRFAQRSYGNRDFIVNSILYLTDDEGWLELRNRQFKLRLLNKVETLKNKTTIKVVNVILPLALLFFAALAFYLRRKKLYANK